MPSPVSSEEGDGDAGAGNIWAELRGWGTPRIWVPSSGTSQSDPSRFPAEAAPSRCHPSLSQLAFWQDLVPTSLVTSGSVITSVSSEVMGSFGGPLLAPGALQRDLQPLGSCVTHGTSTSDGLSLIYLLLQVSLGTSLPLFK